MSVTLALIIVQVGVILLSLVFMIAILITSGPMNDIWIKTQKYYTIALFSVFFLVYVALLITLAIRLKKNFRSFYIKERSRIFLVNGVIMFAILARIGMNAFSSIYQ